MAILWGGWEYSGGNGMRVGVELSWSNVVHGSSSATLTVEYYTENQFSYSDTQTLTFSGAIGGSVTFSNNSGGGVAVPRATRTRTYDYPASSYGSSPGMWNIGVTLSGAFNGVTPARSVNTNIPARPIAAPLAPGSVANSRVNDDTTKVSWDNNATAGRPYDNLRVQRSTNGGGWVNAAVPGGGATYANVATDANRKYDFQVRAENNAGNSGWVNTAGAIYTTPAAPSGISRTDNSTSQTIAWNNNVGWPETTFKTQVWGYKNGVGVGLLGEVNGTLNATSSFIHDASNATAAYTQTDKWKYRVRHVTTAGMQPTLHSAFSTYTTETTGQTFPPLAPTSLSPAGASLDPTLKQRLQWVHNHGGDNATQTQFRVRHRKAGAETWTEFTSAASVSDQFWDMPANTYGDNGAVDGETIEWAVQTLGADVAWSPWSDSESFTTAFTPVAADPIKVPLVLDLFSGNVEASTNANLVSNYLRRAQSMMIGGGVKSMNQDQTITWSKRFLPISMGTGPTLFPEGHHDIEAPFSWTVSNKVLTNNVATLTVTASTMRARPGERIRVSGVGTPFDGDWTVRSVESNKVSYDCIAANVSSASSGGNVGAIIYGHGGTDDLVPTTAARTYLTNWRALWYELPFGWGAGNTLRKNGVVAVTSASLTSNVATLTLSPPHFFVIGDRIRIEGVGAPFDGSNRFVTAMTSNTVSFALTNANIANTPVSGIAAPSGKDTFFGNFHQTYYTSDFEVPENWLLIALKSADDFEIYWGTGDYETDWKTPTLSSGWNNLEASVAPARYRRKNGVIFLGGSVGGGASGSTIFTLPEGYRPKYQQRYRAGYAGNGQAFVLIRPTGAVEGHYSFGVNITLDFTFIID